MTSIDIRLQADRFLRARGIRPTDAIAGIMLEDILVDFTAQMQTYIDHLTDLCTRMAPPARSTGKKFEKKSKQRKNTNEEGCSTVSWRNL